MNKLPTTFLTSAIPYVNGGPHLGHALELVQSDACARFERARGRDVRHASGTDDNSLKNVRAAELAGVSVAEFVASYGAEFVRLAETLNVAHDDFVHTGRDPRHVLAVSALWQRCAERGDLYRKAYSGQYCVGCEQFLRASELVEGACRVHREPLELIAEENWFFRLSKYGPVLLEAVEQGTLQVLPKERLHEVCQFIRAGLEDFSISRSRARSKGWGIPVPGDDTQTVYVWFDALANYLSGLGFPGAEPFERYWLTGEERWHLIGKDILRFHAVYWPAILLSAGLPLPTSVRVHGFITSEGKKLGKSAGNGVDPFRLVARYGVDAVRYYLLAHLHSTKDSDFREPLLRAAYDAELAGKLGNLLQRVCALCVRHEPTLHGGELEAPLSAVVESTRTTISQALARFSLQDALSAIFELVNAANRYADAQAPWRLAKLCSEASSAERRAEAREQLRKTLSCLVASLAAIARLLAPFLPETAERIHERLAPQPSLGPPLFPQLQ